MPTRDERREVAKRLREYIVYAKEHDLYGDYGMGSGKVIETRCTLYNDIASCIEECGNFNLSAEEVFTRLADLIDPTCKVSSVETYDDELGQLEGWEFHLTCGHSFQRPWNEPPAYCPECGARVVERGDA